jgi:hypothetical protein
MGHAPHAILAYGHDLGVVYDYEPIPDWYDEDEDWLTSAQAELMRAAGQSFDPAEHISESQLLEFTGVQLIRWGDCETPTFILAARSIETDWDGPVHADMALPDNAHERLTWAIETLGLNPDDTKARWLLAAYMPG